MNITTVSEATQAIYLTFNDKTVLSADEVRLLNNMIVENVSETNAILEIGFAELVKLNICAAIPNSNKYVLVRPLNQVTQQLNIPYDIASLLVQELNTFVGAVQKPELKAAVGDLSVRDLSTIILALKILNSSNSEENSDS